MDRLYKSKEIKASITTSGTARILYVLFALVVLADKLVPPEYLTWCGKMIFTVRDKKLGFRLENEPGDDIAYFEQNGCSFNASILLITAYLNMISFIHY